MNTLLKHMEEIGGATTIYGNGGANHRSTEVKQIRNLYRNRVAANY